MTKKEFWNLLTPSILMLGVAALAFLPNHFVWKNFFDHEWQSDRQKMTSWIEAAEAGHADITQQKVANALHFARTAGQVQYDHGHSLEQFMSQAGWIALVSIAVQVGLVWQLKIKLARRASISADHTRPAVTNPQ